MKTLDLNGKWKFKAVNSYNTLPREHNGVMQWMNATVPGTVHTDLLQNRNIQDPFYRTNELEVQWIDTQQWMYKKEFTVPKRLLREDAVYLVAEGLDTYALIRLNGKKIAQTANMFIEHHIGVTKYLRTGKNVIEILFDSPTMRSKILEKKHGALRVASEPARVYVRKAQYSFGWDWGPKLATSGIWRNISLQAFSGGRLKDPFIKILSVNKREAIAEVSVEVEQMNRASLTVRMFIAGGSDFIEHETTVLRPKVKFRLSFPSPNLWWPNGYGDQPMYKALFSLLKDGKEIHQLEVDFAIRTVKLIHEKDAEGKSFIFEINNMKMFCKGADWIPTDSFVPRVSDSTYETLLQMAKDAHMNMVRVWGGGIYEQEIFYRLCDQLGLMVWQDFMYACGEYPEAPWFATMARDEAEFVAKRLRNHPSIVLWCGNNECEWLFCTENPDKSPDDMKGATIFRDVFPAVCEKHDGTRPYWRSSPFGVGFPNAESSGNHHQWMVWSNWKDYKEYENDNARFVTEFGFQAPANRQTFEEITIPSDRHPQSLVMEHHNKQIEGTERLLRFQAAHYRLSDTFDGFIYKGQLVQAEALKCAVEHWRRRKFETAGALFWQLNDCWPVSSWAAVDSALRPKAGYYFAKKFFTPVLISFKGTARGVEVWVTNDLLKVLSAGIVIELNSFHGKTAWRKNLSVTIPTNSSEKIYRVDSSVYANCDPPSCYLHAQLSIAGDVVSENRLFFVEPKHLKLPKTRVVTILTKTKTGRYLMNIRSRNFVKNIRLEIAEEDVVFDDNYFDCDAGAVKKVTFESAFSLRELKRKLTMKWL